MSLDIPIDPVLLAAPFGESTAHHQSISVSTSRGVSTASPVSVLSSRSLNGRLLEKEEYAGIIQKERKKLPFQEACKHLGLNVPASANLERLRRTLLEYHFPPEITTLTDNSPTFPIPRQLKSNTTITFQPEIDDAALVQEFAVDGADSEDILGYDNEDLNPEEGDDEDDPDVLPGLTKPIPDSQQFTTNEEYLEYQLRVRVEAVERAEQSRRAGGIKTQQAVVKAWHEFTDKYRKGNHIRDDIVDEHSLLLFIKHNAERPKKTRQGAEIPGTFVGAAHQKKMFFGALRIRKQQVAENPQLNQTRPATSVIVWDAIKNRMNEALNRARSGLVPNEDAPDIIANTFLAEVTEEQLDKIGDAFLTHRLLRQVIYGHLAWNAQHATGNRGDDFRSLKLAELQPWDMLHPNKETKVTTILGLQNEEKAGRKGMRTVVNPVYSTFIAHRNPVKCPIGAFMFYFHYVHDVLEYSETLNVDWTVNKSWRPIYVLSAPGSPTTPLSESSLYNLYVSAFNRAGFVSRMKAHLPRHLLGFKQEAEGVDPRDTARLGWKRGETYADTYQPGIAKPAVLAAHGYREHEHYDPVWRHIHVPEKFLRLVCPMAEERANSLEGKPNLVGATKHWRMIRDLRPCFFQCGAAIYQRVPNSPLFKLPAFANLDVRNWMQTGYPHELALLEASQGNPVDFSRIQDALMRNSLEEMRSIVQTQHAEIKELKVAFLRRTAPLSPSQGFSVSHYNDTYTRASKPPTGPSSSLAVTAQPPVYLASDSSPRAYVNASPKTPNSQREPTQVDLVLPPVAAFHEKDEHQLLWPPILGQKAVTWPDVFSLIKRPSFLWDVWRPLKTLDQYQSVEEVWRCYTIGEAEINAEGEQTGMRPPLRLVEQAFQHRWRTGSGKDSTRKKAWQRFREIPEWIDRRSVEQGVAPADIIKELEDMRVSENGRRLGLNALMKQVKSVRQEEAQKSAKQTPASSSQLPSLVSTPPSSPSISRSSSTPATLLQSPFRFGDDGEANATLSDPMKKRKRAPAIGARSRSIKLKTSKSI